MSYLIINGGKKLGGAMVNQSAKNSAVAILCACVVLRGKATLSDVPEIEEVRRMVELLTSIGVKVESVGRRKLFIDSSGELNLAKIDKEAVEKTRASLLLWGALAGRVKRYSMPKPGGCRLGERTVRPHWYALKKFGMNVASEGRAFEIENPRPLRVAEIVMYESGDTTTENAIMAAVAARGTTVIKMASANYMVQDLCYFLQRAGAKIQGIGSTTLIIEGGKRLKAVKNYPIMPDPIAAMTYLSAAIVTGSKLAVKNCPLDFLDLELCKLEVMGQKFKVLNARRSKNGKFRVADIEVVPSKLKSLPDKIYGRPFPGLNIDNLPLFVPILTQARGCTMVHDWAYENRAKGYLDLRKLGARVRLLDPHRVLVEGPTKFRPNMLTAPPALRLAVVDLICMLAAPGRSVLRNAYAIDRGYENLYETLNKAGADIKKM